MKSNKKYLNEFDAAILIKMSPTFLRWCTAHNVNNNVSKLSFKQKDEVYYYLEKDLNKLDTEMNTPWDKPPKGQRPNIPAGIKREVKTEALARCPICNTTAGEYAHIIPVSKSMCNHPHNLIFLCNNHHREYDFGYKYRNITKEEVLEAKKYLQLFNRMKWKLKSKAINSLLSLINTVDQFKGLEKKFVKFIESDEVDDFFKDIVKQFKANAKSMVVEKNAKKEMQNNSNEFLTAINSKTTIGYKKRAYSVLKYKSEIISNSDSICSLCNGNGHTHYFDICPACGGEGEIPQQLRHKIDYSQWEIEECPLCEGAGRTENFDICPPCRGSGETTKEFKDNTDYSQWSVIDCPLCEGSGRTDYFDICPPCDGSGETTKEYKDNTDYSQWDVTKCPLCKGKGCTDYFDVCPPCDGAGEVTNEYKNREDFSKWSVVNCPICKGKGYNSLFDVCPPCDGGGKITKEFKDNTDFSQWDI